MIKSVVFEFHWTPHYIECLHCDDADIFSIGYWYNSIADMHKETAAKYKK